MCHSCLLLPRNKNRQVMEGEKVERGSGMDLPLEVATIEPTLLQSYVTQVLGVFHKYKKNATKKQWLVGPKGSCACDGMEILRQAHRHAQVTHFGACKRGLPIVTFFVTKGGAWGVSGLDPPPSDIHPRGAPCVWR